ncbi:hypothetical protein Dimus_014984 [Dionaea muscipula]
MVVDYYHTLRVSPTVADEELRRSYKRLAMRWHPDKNPPATRHVAESKFKQICEAYDVLSDPLKRQIYDRYGEEGLKSGAFPDVSSPSSAAAAAAAAAGGGGGKKGSFRYDSAEAEDGFQEVSAGGGGGGKAVALEIPLACTLEELYTGCRKKMKISRTVLDSHDNPVIMGEVLAVDVEPGWKKGTRITFPGKGHHEPGLQPGDIVFVIEEKPHPIFKRNGNDLIVHQRISLLEALTGKTLVLTTLDGRDLTMNVSDIVRPGHETVILGEGMPLSKDPKTRGDLRVKFDVKFPSRLSADQKSDLKRVLGGRSSS